MAESDREGHVGRRSPQNGSILPFLVLLGFHGGNVAALTLSEDQRVEEMEIVIQHRNGPFGPTHPCRPRYLSELVAHTWPISLSSFLSVYLSTCLLNAIESLNS